MSTEDKKPCLQGFIPSWSFLTRLRRPHLFSHKRKDGGEKSAWTRLVRAVSDFRRGPSFQASFHTILTLRASWYAPPDTEVPNLQPVALEQLLSIEGTVEIQMDITFSRGPCRGGALLRPRVLISSEQRAEQSPAPTECAPKASPMWGSLFACVGYVSRET